MATKDIHIYGAGLSGLVAAITLAKEGHNVIVHEKEKRIGGTPKCNPSIHMTPIHIQQMEKLIEIEIEKCFTKLDTFRGYIGSKKYLFSTKNLYVVERGPRESSLDYFLYKKALDKGVIFKFSDALTKEKLENIQENSIIATAGYSKLIRYLRIPYVIFKQYDMHTKTDLENITIAYFGKYTSDYGYISCKNGILSAQVSGASYLNQKNLDEFIDKVRETEDIKLDAWSSIISCFPKKARLFTKFNGKTAILAGDIAGFLDPFFGFGVNGALISGKIAAMSIKSKKKAIQEFKQYSSKINRDLLLHTIYWHLPFKKMIHSQFMKYHRSLSLIRGSIPGFNDEDWLKIVSVMQGDTHNINRNF